MILKNMTETKNPNPEILIQEQVVRPLSRPEETDVSDRPKVVRNMCDREKFKEGSC